MITEPLPINYDQVPHAVYKYYDTINFILYAQVVN